ncbi:MAG: hypothetical protein ISN26_07055 [Betaproteobacteria bacterium AqS2]|uniref:Uncharacterized protein n=1 Tax=Candidatus Amphirhobacter heronislandensis TaxID=1732024 RepID=A0A930UFU5_9GAMM|nr:hypothetical protein [Betaproteobacteria bacterium AqS2]
MKALFAFLLFLVALWAMPVVLSGFMFYSIFRVAYAVDQYLAAVNRRARERQRQLRLFLDGHDGVFTYKVD